MLTGARSKSEAKRIAVQKGEAYFFPEHQKTVEAETREEAEAKIKQEEK